LFPEEGFFWQDTRSGRGIQGYTVYWNDLQFSTPLETAAEVLQAGSEKNKLNLHPDTVNQKLQVMMEKKESADPLPTPTVKVLCRQLCLFGEGTYNQLLWGWKSMSF